MATVPDIAAVRAWSGVTAQSVTDDQLSQILAAEIALQNAACNAVPSEPPATEMPDALAQALLRRCSRELAARQLALGLSADSNEYGPVRLPSFDVEIERLEAPYRFIAIA